MVNKSQGTWYVSFELPRGKRALARATETFPNEREAKKFIRDGQRCRSVLSAIRSGLPGGGIASSA
jgi:hypothetical protein